MKTTAFLFFIIISSLCMAQIPADSAKYYVGKKVEVCGKVIQVAMSAKATANSNSLKTALEFGSKKDISFIAEVPRLPHKFENDEEKKYLDSTVCVSGIITLTYQSGYGHGIPTITVESEDQVKFR